MSQIITVTFAEGQREAIAAQPLEQWAYGQKLQFEGLDLPEAYRVDFSNFEFCGASIPRVGGADGVAVPVEVLTSGRNVYAFIWIQDEASGARYRRATVRVIPGPEPDTDESPEEKSAVTEAINALNDAAEAIPEQVNAALQDAKESGDFDGVSPAVQITAIEGGHRITITDAEHPTGQSFDVMDGSAGGSGELYIVDYDQSASASPDVDEIVAAFDAGKAVLACATDADGGGHVLPLTAIIRESGAVTALTFSAGRWSLAATKMFATWAWFLTKDEPPAEDLVLTFSASWNDDAEAYAVTTTATRAQIDEALAAGQRIEARLMVDNRQLLRQGTVYAERYGSTLNSVTIGFIGEAGEIWALTGTGGGWELEKRAIGGGSIELDTTLSKPGEAADAAAVGAALANKGTYSKPSGGIPASDLAAGVIPTVPTKTSDLTNDSGFVNAAGAAAAAPIQSVNGKTGAVVLNAADVGGGTYSKPSGGIPASDLAAGVIPTVPTKTSDLTNDSGFVNAAGAAAAAPVQSVNGKTGAVVLNASDVGAGTYSKPAGGIPKTDLASAVQTSLGKADTALQSVPSTYRTAAAQDSIDAAQDTAIAGKLSTTGNAYRAVSLPIGHLDSTSTATVMTATVPGITELRDGVFVWLHNGVITSASGVTLNINGLGAKPIYNSLSGAVVTTTFAVASTYLFVYNSTRVTGGCWDMVYGYDANTTYTPAKLGQGYAVCSTPATTVAKTASISSYTLTAGGIVAIKFEYEVPANATLNITSKGAKAIYYRGSPITAGVIKAGDTVTMIYSTYYHVLSIDHVTHPSDNNPLMDDTASPGSSTDYARADHVHPSDSSKIGKDDGAVMVTMTARGSTVTCTKGFDAIYVLFASQQKTYFVLANSQTDVQVFDIARVDIGNRTIYLSSIVGGVLSQIVLTPGGSGTMTGTLSTIDLNLQNASGVSF